VDQGFGKYYLEQAFENASLNPHNMEIMLKHADYKPSPEDLCKRLGGLINYEHKKQWFSEACATRAIGSIYDEDSPLLPTVPRVYNGAVRHSYSNQAYRMELLQGGTTHVAVGFVDLGTLLVATLREESAPLRFVGIESSPYAVAKTHVVWKMLQQTPTDSGGQHLQHIVQVWFSTTWSSTTNKAFAYALTAVLASGEAYHKDVRALLEHWAASEGVSLAEARSQWKNATSDSRPRVGHFLHLHDRVMMAKYELTGDFGVDIPSCGNI
jgi:hypothetical protein